MATDVPLYHTGARARPSDMKQCTIQDKEDAPVEEEEEEEEEEGEEEDAPQVFKLPWREAGPPNHHDDKVDSDQ